VLDTVFVTGEGIRHDHDSWSRVLTDLPETYVDVTMLATYAWAPGAELRFYSGATPRRPTNGHVQRPADQHNHPCHRKETTRASGTPPTRRDGRATRHHRTPERTGSRSFRPPTQDHERLRLTAGHRTRSLRKMTDR
jgi:hypothetical protein